MATKTLAQLPAAGAIVQGDLLHTSQGGVDAGVTEDAIAQYAVRLSRYAPVSIQVSGTYTVAFASTVQDQHLAAACTATSYTITLPAATSATFPSRVVITRLGVGVGVLSVTGINNYGGTVRLFNDQDTAMFEVTQSGASTYVWEMVEVLSTGSVALATTPFTSTFGDQVRGHDITTGASAFVFNLPALSTTPGKEYIITKVDSGAGAVQVTPNGTDPVGTGAGGAAYNLTAAGHTLHIINAVTSWEVVAGPTSGYLSNVGVFSSGSPATLVPFQYGTVIVTATPYTINLPAATGSGYKVRIINAKTVAGLVTITPNGTDKIGPAGNVSVFLQNVDQSGAPFLFQSIEIVDDISGSWAVVGGQLCPHQTVDTDGQQYHLGKLHHLPLGNTTDRTLNGGAAFNPAAQGAWFASAITAWGNAGVPSGAKAIRARVRLSGAAPGVGQTVLTVCFSDNNSSTPGLGTAHPSATLGGMPQAAGNLFSETEIDIPLNSSGQLFAYSLTVTNITVGSSNVRVAVVGWYMGN
jgi:hypothetical protein